MASISSGFISGGRSWGAGVVVRVSASGWAWAFRSARSASGSFTAPACVCVPFASFHLARSWARSLSGAGWRCWVRRGRRCPGAAFEVKVVLPAGVSARAARAQLPCPPSSLAVLGV